MTHKLLQCLCPCFFRKEKQQITIELPLLRKVSKLEFPERQYKPHLSQRKITEDLGNGLQLQQDNRRSTSSCRAEEHQKKVSTPHFSPDLTDSSKVNGSSHSKDEYRSFKSFKQDISFNKSSSMMKRSIKLFRMPGSNKPSQGFHSVADGIIISTCQDPAYQQIMMRLYDWTQSLDNDEGTSNRKNLDLVDLERIRKISLLEIRTKVQEFEYFLQENNLVYSNPLLQMQVQVRDFPQVFQSRIYAVLCRFRIKCSILSLYSLLNSQECQLRLNNFSRIRVCQKQPYLIVRTELASNLLAARKELEILKFSQLIAQEINSLEKTYVMQIDRDVSSSSIGKGQYKRMTKVCKEDAYCIAEIYTEVTLDFKPGVNQKSYFENCYRKFSEFLLKKLPEMKA